MLCGAALDSSIPTEALLRRIRRFGPLSADESHAIRDAVGQTRRHPARAEIVRQGERSTESCLILRGFAQREVTLEDGRRQVTAVHVPGDFCDLHSLLLKETDDGVTTLTECEIAILPHDKLREIVRTQPHLTRILWLMTLIDAAVHRQWMIGLGRLTAYERIAHFLCEMLMRLAAVDLVHQKSFVLPMTQDELGDILGLTTVHVNRMLRALRTDGLVLIEGRTVTIRDWHQLALIGQFDGRYLRLDETLERE